MRSLVWFRSDLRTHNNPALHHATTASDDEVIAVFVFTPEQWQDHDWGDGRVAFVRRNVAALSEGLTALNIPLLIRTCPSFAEQPDVLDAIAREFSCGRLLCNEEYEINEVRRDRAIREAWEAEGREVLSFTEQVILPPGSVKTNDDDWYKVFTPFKKAWIRTLNQRNGPQPLVAPRAQATMPCESDPIPDTVEGYDLKRDRDDLWRAGEAHAQERLRRFVEERIQRYHECRDFPSAEGTSAVSPYLAAGVLSPLQCLWAVIEETGTPWPDVALHDDGPGTWINELIWREFYRHLIVGYPRLCMHQPFKPETDNLFWRTNEDDFRAWCEGRTGFPIVDAAMTQLNQTGWMHNRLRMIVAMFLTKQLLIDWRWGERYFMEHLIDGDLASNNGGWQWSASTGTDAAPYFRIFNPWSQSKRYDNDGAFIKTMLPELEDVPAAALHDPDKLARHRPASYPEPICDHKAARQRALEAFKSL